jgi:hypothetical protein
MMISRQKLGLLAALCLVWTTACGGGKKDAAEPEPAGGGEEEYVEEDEGDDGGDVLIPAEKFEEVKSFFDRKRRLVSRCFVKALEAGEVKETDDAKVQITMTIKPNGKISNAKITRCSHASPVLRGCVLDYVKSWTVTTLPKDFDYSYTFGMGRL